MLAFQEFQNRIQYLDRSIRVNLFDKILKIFAISLLYSILYTIPLIIGFGIFVLLPLLSQLLSFAQFLNGDSSSFNPATDIFSPYNLLGLAIFATISLYFSSLSQIQFVDFFDEIFQNPENYKYGISELIEKFKNFLISSKTLKFALVSVPILLISSSFSLFLSVYLYFPPIMKGSPDYIYVLIISLLFSFLVMLFLPVYLIVCFFDKSSILGLFAKSLKIIKKRFSFVLTSALFFILLDGAVNIFSSTFLSFFFAPLSLLLMVLYNSIVRPVLYYGVYLSLKSDI